MEKVTSKHGKGLSLEYTNISCPTDFDTIYALKFTTVRRFLSCFSSKGHWASLAIHHHPLHSNSFPAFLLDTSHEQQRVKLHMKTFVPDRTLGLQFKLIFAQLLEHSRGVAKIFPWGTWPKYCFRNFCKCNLGQYPLPRGCVIPGGSEYFPNYLNGYVPLNRVVILERFRLLRNSACRVASRLGKTLK